MNTACVIPQNSQNGDWMSFPGKRSSSYPRNLTIRVKRHELTVLQAYKYLFLEIEKAKQKYQMHNDEIV